MLDSVWARGPSWLGEISMGEGRIGALGRHYWILGEATSGRGRGPTWWGSADARRETRCLFLCDFLRGLSIYDHVKRRMRSCRRKSKKE